MTDQAPAYEFPTFQGNPAVSRGGGDTSGNTRELVAEADCEPRLKLHQPDAAAETASPVEHVAPTPSELLCSDIVDYVLKAAHRLRAVLADHFAKFELSDVRFAVLRFLHEAEPVGCTQSELAHWLDQSESSISTLVKRMRDSGLLYRLRSTIDKRKWALKLTETGRGQLDSARNCHARRMAELLDAFDADERARLAELLKKLVSELIPKSADERARDIQSTAQRVSSALAVESAPETPAA